MNQIGLVIFIAVALITGVFLYQIDRPAKKRRKITGRGGDFEG